MDALVYQRSVTLEELVAYSPRLAESFGIKPGPWGEWAEMLGAENLRLLRRGGEAIGALGIYPMGQFFGGRSLRSGGFAGVGISPEHRGAGVAEHLMGAALRDLREAGVPIATLYASTRGLYRKVGFEVAGTRTVQAVPVRRLSPGDRTLPVRRVPLEASQFEALHRARAERSAGLLDRTPALWARLFRERDLPVHGYLFGPEDAPEGYAVLTHKSAADPAAPGADLVVRDVVARTPAATRRFWTFVADQRSLMHEVHWCGPSVDPLTMALPEALDRVTHFERWLLRIVDLRGALEGRGYGAGVEGELHLEVDDGLLPENRGRFVLRVAKGRAEVSAGGRGELRVTERGLAPLYSGFLGGVALASAGLIAGADDALATATRLFAGPEPWMPDFF